MQALNGPAKMLRVFVGETDMYHHTPLYEAILRKAKETGLAGGTVIKGILSFGASSVLHTSKLLDISEDLPVITEIIDTEEKVRSFAGVVSGMLEECGCGGMVTIQEVEVIHHQSKNSGGDAV